MLFNLSDRMDKNDKGKSVNQAYPTEDLTPDTSVAPASATKVEYGMPPN